MGDKKTAIKLFESKEIRTAWDSEKEEWYFSIQDVVEALTDSADVKQCVPVVPESVLQSRIKREM